MRLSQFEKILKLDPENYAALNELGHTYALMGKYDKAIKLFEKAKKTRPKLPTAYNRLGNVYDDQLKYAQAMKEYNLAMKNAPADQESYRNMAESKYRAGRHKGRHKDA